MDTIWLSRQNTIEKAIRVDGVPINAPNPLGATNRIRLALKDKDGVETALDSADFASFFSTSTQRIVAGNQVRVITLALGQAGLALGEYDAVLTIFDATYTTGLVVGEFKISVRSA